MILEKAREMKHGDVIRFVKDGHIYIRRIKAFDEDERQFEYYNANFAHSYISVDDVEDEILKPGDTIVMYANRSVQRIIEAYDASEERFNLTGDDIWHSIYDGIGRLTFYIVDDPGKSEEEKEPAKPEKVINDDKIKVAKIVADCCAVLDAANHYEYKESAVYDMVVEWWRNKKNLIAFLRKHPNWNEENLAVEGFVDEVRENNSSEYLNANKAFYGHCRANGMYLTDAQLDIMWDCVQCLTPKTNIDQAMVDKYIEMGVEKTCGFVPHVGEKYSRVLNKVFKSMGLDKLENYNKDFAVIADSINPLDNKQKAILSVHPCDYLKMSWGEKWKSCHDIRDKGCYHAGTQSYMMDGTSMVFYTVSNHGQETSWKNNKLTRQMFCYSNGNLLQSRCYPAYDNNARNDNYLAYVKEIINTCRDLKDATYTTYSDSRRLNYLISVEGHTHYRDYEYDQYRTRVLVSNTDAKIKIGHMSMNLLNGKLHSRCDNINFNPGDISPAIAQRNIYQDTYYICEYCGSKFYTDEGEDYEGYDSDNDVFYCGGHYRTCDKCGETVFGLEVEEGYWCNHDQEDWYCRSCGEYHLERCDHCDEYFDPDVEGGRDSAGNYCGDCADNATVCDQCGEYIWDEDDVYWSENGYSYCADCYNELFTRCEHCDEEVIREEAIERDGCYYCPDCYEELFPEEDEEEEEDDEEVAEDNSSPEIPADNSNLYHIDKRYRLNNPLGAFERGYNPDRFRRNFDGNTAQKIDQYSVSGRNVYILREVGTDTLIAVFEEGCRTA